MSYSSRNVRKPSHLTRLSGRENFIEYLYKHQLGFTEDGALALKHAAILYAYNFQSFYVHLLVM